MTVMEKIYEAFIAGELSIRPESPLSMLRAELSKLEQGPGLSDDQLDDIEELLLGVADEFGRKMFRAGFALAVKMSGELYSQPDKSLDKFLP